MCGRAALTASPAELREVFGLDETPDIVPHYNVPPSRPLEVVRVLRGATSRKLEPLRWGLVPPWAKDPKIGSKLTLARAETVAHTGAFREAFLERRCLVAVDGFYEWKRSGKGASTPFFVCRADRKPFALAGLWSRWVSSDGEVIESCAILTQAARAPVDAIHDRMPVVLDPADWTAWLETREPLDGSETAAEALEPLLVPRPHDRELVSYAVGPYVNDPRHDDAGCVEPAEIAQQTLF
ncbi:MAG TPA: SOS response-associated peptidase [Polyangiaceae bacterium]